jgi:Ala-tRNA(Pro) deacylase
MPAAKLREYLDANRVKYVTVRHSLAYTAQEVAASAHVRGRDMAKTVVVTIDGVLALAVVPADQKVDVERVREAAGATRVAVATEWDFRSAFPECELGAMPPFGNLFGMKVFVDPRLVAGEEIAFNAGTHTEVMRLASADYLRLVKPTVVQVT